jgi:anti-anti-sigma regulatory factor
MRVTRIPAGYCVCVEGRGTLRESPAVHALARQVLDSEPGTLVLDLEACEYLDSTCLGALVDLHRRYGADSPVRFLVAAGTEVRMRLFGPNCLETLFHYVDERPELLGEGVELAAPALEREDLGRHVLECHRRLVELGGPNQAAMQGVVERLEHELVGH